MTGLTVMGLFRTVADEGFAEGQMHRTEGTERQPGAVWHGHRGDFERLVSSVLAHCTCGHADQAADGGRRPCSAHRMLGDQHALDHLAFTHRMRQQILDSEWVVYWDADERVGAGAEAEAQAAAEPRGIGRLDLLLGRHLMRLEPADSTAEAPPAEQPAAQGASRHPRRWRGLAYGVACLLMAASLGAPLLGPSPAPRPMASWQSR